MSEQVTDPAREMAALLDWARLLKPTVPPGQTPPAHQVFTQAWELDPGTPAFLELVLAVRVRLAALDQLALQLDGPNVGSDVTRHVRAAIQRFSSAFNPVHLSQPWNHYLNNWLQEGDATTLRMYGPTAVQFRPLRVLSDEDRDLALAEVVGAISDIEAASDIGIWEKQALLRGYKHLQLVLQYLRFFGHDGLSQEIIAVSSVTRGVSSNLRSASSTLRKAWSALALAAKIVEVVAAPSVAYHAGADYYEFLRLGSPQPQVIGLLPAPSAEASECVAPDAALGQSTGAGG